MNRTKEQILNEAVFAIACVAKHYGPELSEEGLAEARELLKKLSLCTDVSYQVDVEVSDKYVDFHQRIIWPVDWDLLDFQTVVNESNGIV